MGEKCRGCGMALNGIHGQMSAVTVPGTGRNAKWNYYGGFCCSRACDERACRELEDDMPGHGIESSARHGLSTPARNKIEANWGSGNG